MRLGFTETVLVLAIFLIVFGPAVYSRVSRWLTRAGSRAQKQSRLRNERAEALRAEREAFLLRLRRTLLAVLAVALAGSALYLCFWPLETKPAAVKTPYAASAEGAAPTMALDEALALDISPYRSPVAVVFYEDWLYAAVDGGKIIRIRENGTGLTEVLSTGGEITDLAFGPDGALYFTDAAYTAAGGAVLCASFDGWAVSVAPVAEARPDGSALSCPTALAVGRDGTVYFADAVAFRAQDGVGAALADELLARSASGGVYAVAPKTGKSRALMEGLSFAAGLALSENGDTLYISELCAGTVWSVPAAAPRDDARPVAAVAAKGLPGYPAHLSFGENGELWAALAGPRFDWLDSAEQNLFVRSVLLRLPRMTKEHFLSFDGASAAVALGADAAGEVTGTLLAQKQSTAGRMPALAAITPVGQRLYLAAAGGQSKIEYIKYYIG